MEKYVTVVSVDDQVPGASVGSPVEPDQPDPRMDLHLELTPHRPLVEQVGPDQEDSQFVTVLSINHGEGRSPDDTPSAPEVVLVYRLPGERLGFGLKFQGGNRSNEKIQRLFIQSCAENSPASRVLASWGHLREGDEILEIDGVSVTRMTRIECVKCLKDSNVAIKLLVRNGEGRVQNFYPETGQPMMAMSGGSRENVGEIPERKSGPPPPPPVPPRKLNKRKLTPVEPQSAEVAPKQPTPPTVQELPPMVAPPPPDAESYSNLFADDISDLISESDDTASTISTVVDKFSICSSLSSEDYTIPSNGPMGIGSQSLELAKALKPFTLLEQEFNLESKFEPTNLFTFKPPAAPTSNVVQLAVQGDTEYENVSVMKVDENRNYENVTVPYGPFENVTIQTVQPYETMVLARTANRRRISVEEPEPSPVHYENVDLKTSAVPPRPLPRQAAIVEPKKRAPIPVPIPIVVPPPRLKHTSGGQPQPLGAEYNTVQSWLQDATEVIHECALVPGDGPVVEEKPKPLPDGTDDLPRLIDFHPKVSVAPKEAVVAPPTSPTTRVRYNGEPDMLVAPETIVRKCIKIIASEDHTYIESSSSDEDDEKMYCMGRSEDDDDRSSVLSRETTTTPEQFLSGDGYSDEDGEKLGPPEIVSGGPSEAYFNFPWSSNLLPPIGEVEEEFSSLEHQQHQPIVIIDTADETVITDTNNNQQRRERKKPIGDESPQKPPKAGGPSANIVIGMATLAAEENDPEADQPDAGVNAPVDSSLTIDQDVGAPETDNLQRQQQQQHQEVSDPEPPAAAVDEDELVNNVHTADKPDQPVVDNGGPSAPPGTCQQDVSDMANDGPDGRAVPVEHPQHPPEAPGPAPAESVGPIDNRSATADRNRPGDVPEATAALPDDADGGESERTAEGRKLQDDDGGEDADSNIDAIVGDVDIVEGDTVESDFEELVKAQIEPVDVEDSSEQIQQIHERIIVGIERAVSEQVSEAADVAPVPLSPDAGDKDNEWSEVTQGQLDQPKRDFGDVPVAADSEVADKAQDTAEQG
ncbi:titin-like [Anopheles bellator]|uniref:titin-like n=1 Tax=Anopheles bellator TaxID=139047 RepID=UPI002649DD64|nr:titin-like [Anopheles bellator]